jgi:hypothetical protein
VNELPGEHSPLLEGWMRVKKYREATLVRADGRFARLRQFGSFAIFDLCRSLPSFSRRGMRLIPIDSHLQIDRAYFVDSRKDARSWFHFFAVDSK